MTLNDVKTIAVIGAGTMGHGIAQVALMNGYLVNLCDINESAVQSGVDKIAASLKKLASKGKFPSEKIEEVLCRHLNTFVSVEDAVKEADFVIEAVPEVMELKIQTFQTIDRVARPEVIIASNTSAMSIQQFAESIQRRDQIIGMHYFVPAVLMPLVEVIQCKYTSPETAKFACDYVRKIGKTLVFAKKDTPGFIASRIYSPLCPYYQVLLDQGKFTPQDVDYTLRTRLGLKMGPYELMDFSGLDLMVHTMEYYHTHLHPDYNMYGHVKQLVERGCYGKKTLKGVYEWPADGSRPVVDASSCTGGYNPDIHFFLQANEATKLLEEGVCTAEDCDTAMRCGYNQPGPLAYARKFRPDYVTEVLNGVAEEFNSTLYLPTETIRSGKF